MNKTVLMMAIKNLFANKTKMIITLSLIGIGTFFIILGLGILNFAKQQTQNVCISDFCGDILITGKPEEKDVTVELLGATRAVNINGFPKMPYVMPVDKITAQLQSMPEVASIAHTVVSGAILKPIDLSDSWKAEVENLNSLPLINILGIDVDNYQKTFDAVKIYEGQYPQSGQRFILIDKKVRERFEKYYNTTLNVGDEILLSSFSGKRRQQRAVIAGFFTYAHPDTAIGKIGYADADTCRVLADMTLGAKTAAQIPESIDLSLSEKSEEDLFSSFDDSIVETEVSASAAGKTTDIDNLLGSTELRDKLNMADNEAWHHIAVKLTHANDTDRVIQTLNDWFASENIHARAVNWEKAMATYVAAIETTRVVLIVMLIVLAVVVLIVIMNTLVVAVMQRASEIGTMRAIGAKKSFVRHIFFTESLFMSLTGVCIGVVLALVAAVIINSFNIELGDIASLMFGGKKIKVHISYLSVLGTTVAMLAAGIIANWYPVTLALKISPLEAINR